MYDTACKTKAENINIELSTFEKVAGQLHQVWEKTRTARKDSEESAVLGALRQIQNSIAGLE